MGSCVYSDNHIIQLNDRKHIIEAADDYSSCRQALYSSSGCDFINRSDIKKETRQLTVIRTREDETSEGRTRACCWHWGNLIKCTWKYSTRAALNMQNRRMPAVDAMYYCGSYPVPCHLYCGQFAFQTCFLSCRSFRVPKYRVTGKCHVCQPIQNQ